MLAGTDSRPNTWAVVPAAGRGERFGGPVAKQFANLAGGTLLSATLAGLSDSGILDGIVVVVPEDMVGSSELIGMRPKGRLEIKIAAGGLERADSVRSGLSSLPEKCQLVLVHDGVRPNLPADLVLRVAECAWENGACVPVLPALETVKELDENGNVLRTLQRDRLCLVQTPQGFRKDILLQAYRSLDSGQIKASAWDDAALVEAAGHPVATVPGATDNIKITEPRDLFRTGLCLPRVGFGYDVHRLEKGRRLVLCGVEVPGDAGLAGHSDGDVATHALMDAMLGAAALGDIGRHFPDSDPEYAGIESLKLLGEVVARISDAGWMVGSVDLTIVAQKPRLAEHIPGMTEKLAAVLGITTGAIGIKATTEEGLGFTGSGQAMAAHAVAVLGARIS